MRNAGSLYNAYCSTIHTGGASILKKTIVCFTLALLCAALAPVSAEAARSETEVSAWQFVQNRMLDTNGVVYYLASPGGNSHNAVDESMGQAMEYLARVGDAGSFSQYAVTADRYFRDPSGYYYWEVGANGGAASDTTALIDDLRFFRAYRIADENGLGDYSAKMTRLAGDIYDFDVNDDGYPVSSYSGSNGSKSTRLDLFYLDTETMEKMIAYDGRWQEPYDNGVDILLKMPEDANGFYPPRFNVRTRQYQYASNGRTNMVENLYTALFAQDAGRSTKTFADFLRTQVDAGRIYNVYNEDGSPVRNQGESVAVYALAARLLDAGGERAAAKWCYDKFVAAQIASGTFAGGFSMDTDQSVYAFDQLEALLAMQTLPTYAASGGPTGGSSAGGGGGCDAGTGGAGLVLLTWGVLRRKKFGEASVKVFQRS